MLSRGDKSSQEYRKLLSKSAKINWVNFKKKESYNKWRLKRAEAARTKMNSGHAKYMSLLGNTPENNIKRSIQMKNGGLPERKEEKSKSLIEFTL